MAKILKWMLDAYFKHYRILMFSFLAILLLSFVQIGYQTYTTGSFVNKGISLKGGTSFTVLDSLYNAKTLENDLSIRFPDNEFEVSAIMSLGEQKGLIINADTEDKNLETIMISEIEKISGSEQISVKRMGSALAQGFFKELMLSLVVGFIFMIIVIFMLFKTVVPSLAVIMSALTDVIVPIAIINVLGIKISTAGIAAFLMLIGYSVDTDIVLTTKLIKDKEGTVIERQKIALKTGMMMTITSIAAVSVGLILSSSSVLKEIFTILLIGLIVDIPSTWIQNVGVLRLYLEHNEKKKLSIKISKTVRK